jgi:hypothetical protein
MEELLAGDLRITVDATPPPTPPPEGATGASTEAIRLTWHGKSNDRHPGKILLPYLGKALALAATRSAPVELHFEKLEHFNSSTITALIQLIQEGRQKGVKLAFVHDPTLKWQKLSFDALRVFASDGLLEIRAP